MDRMSALDAGFFFAESENTPMHVGSVTVFEGPAPTYGDVVRLLLSRGADARIGEAHDLLRGLVELAERCRRRG